MLKVVPCKSVSYEDIENGKDESEEISETNYHKNITEDENNNTMQISDRDIENVEGEVENDESILRSDFVLVKLTYGSYNVAILVVLLHWRLPEAILPLQNSLFMSIYLKIDGLITRMLPLMYVFSDYRLRAYVAGP
ncbi:hypothetical protein JTB14_001534 [Gonioctena quinquepunctata]|nr:hypothetical protein JTB14_001534 [Gonioctena quinquepunctata]